MTVTYSNILELQFDLDQADEARRERDGYEESYAPSEWLLRTRTPEEQAGWDAALNNLDAMFAPKAVR